MLSPEALYPLMRKAYDELIDFVTTDEFSNLLDDLFRLPESDRPHFVNAIVLSDRELFARGIIRPKDVLLQRSSFGDRRPTLFCAKKLLPDGFRDYWQNVNITFDNPFEDEMVPRDERAWRKPLPFDIQQAVVAGAIEIEP